VQASCASAQQRLPGKLGKLINEPNTYKTKTYKSVYNRKINSFIKAIKIIDPDGRRNRREAPTAEPLLRIPVHFTVLHDGVHRRTLAPLALHFFFAAATACTRRPDLSTRPRATAHPADQRPAAFSSAGVAR